MRAAPARERRRQLSLLLLSVAQFLVVLDFSVVNVALPQMREALGFSAAGVGWVVSGYALAFGGFLMVGGRVADLVGRRRLFVGGLALFGVASTFGGLAATPAEVIAARALQGLGAAVLVPAALALIASLFEEGPQRTHALAVVGGVGAIGSATGVVLGGVLTELLNWRWTFLVNVPVVLTAIALTPLLLPHDRRRREHEPLDLSGAVLGTSALLLFLFALEGTRTEGWASAPTVGALLAALALFALFALVERRAPAPVLPTALLRRRPILGANLVSLVATGTFLPTQVLVSNYMQVNLGFSPLAAGFGFLPMTALTLACSGYISQRMIRRWGLRAVGLIGLCVNGTGLLVLLRLAQDGSYLGAVLPGMALVAAGTSLLFPVVFSTATASVPLGRQGAASAAVSSSRQIGAALGASAMVGAAAAAGFTEAFLIALAAIACGLVAAARMLPTLHATRPVLDAQPMTEPAPSCCG